MSHDRYFDHERADGESVDRAVHVMARRQFAISLFVAFALLAAAGLTAARARHETHVGMAARRHGLGAAPPRAPMAQAALQTMNRATDR
jgi:hypothetical protein